MRQLNQQIQMLVEESATRRKLRQISGGPGPEEAVGLPRRGRGPVHVLCWCPPSPASTDTPEGRGSRSRRSVTRRTSTQQEARLADRQRVERAQKKTFLPPQVLKKLLLIRNRTIKRVKLLIVTLVVITAILLVTVSHQTVILTQTMRMKYQNENPQTTKVAHQIHHPSNLPRYHQFQHHHKTRQNRFDRPIHFIPNRL